MGVMKDITGEKMKIPSIKEISRRTEFDEDAPAKRVQAFVEKTGSDELAAEIFNAWELKLQGHAIVDIAHSMQVSIETCKQLIREAHQAVAEDIKEAVAQNRELDLQRIDRMIRAWYPAATNGDEIATNLMIKLLSQRAKLTGTITDERDPGRGQQPVNVLVWLQNQLPSINKIVDSLPIE